MYVFQKEQLKGAALEQLPNPSLALLPKRLEEELRTFTKANPSLVPPVRLEVISETWTLVCDDIDESGTPSKQRAAIRGSVPQRMACLNWRSSPPSFQVNAALRCLPRMEVFHTRQQPFLSTITSDAIPVLSDLINAAPDESTMISEITSDWMSFGVDSAGTDNLTNAPTPSAIVMSPHAAMNGDTRERDESEADVSPNRMGGDVVPL
ncbi:hypothetical protein [Lysobacter sp. FW306-1B-D06B]|uniref:hypothetical protein n=1 Tax=Lysobacter sp. FW306-1B-D06B TaxID=3140250 RepID=UPI00313FE9BC